jgi:hypothetical protein
MASVPVRPRYVPGGSCLIVCWVAADFHWNLDPSSNVLNSRPLMVAFSLPRWRVM